MIILGFKTRLFELLQVTEKGNKIKVVKKALVS